MGELTKPSRIDFESMDINSIQRIYSTGSLSDLTAAEQVYYGLMEKVRGLRAKMRINGKLVTKAGIIRNLKEADGLTDYQARRVYADAINFFYDSDEIKPRAWANLYAEKCENWANMMITLGKPKEAQRFIKMAADLRGCFKEQELEIPKELLDQMPTVIYTTKSSDLGTPEPDRKKVEEFIDSIPEIPIIVKENVKEDARINGFNLKKRMLFDKQEFADAEEVE